MVAMERSHYSVCTPFLILVLLASLTSSDGTTTASSATSTGSSGTTSSSLLNVQDIDLSAITLPPFEAPPEAPTLKTPPTSFQSLFGFPKAWNPLPDGIHQRYYNATDIWFADPEDEKAKERKMHWNTNNSTYQYLGGYYQPAVGFIVTDILNLLADIETIVRDIIELIIALIRLIRCIGVAIIQDEKIQQFERPQTNLFARHMSIFSKRERIDDRLWDSTTEEPEILRCIKREGNQVTQVLWYVAKAFYYVAKVPARVIHLAVKLIVSIVRIFTSSASLAVGIDHHSCYVVCQILSEKAATLCQETCGGVATALLGAVMDILNILNEDMATESYDLLRIVFVDVDDKISNDELDWYSNLTTWRVADSQDYVRFDGTARIDRYFRDTAAKIMANELYEPHPTRMLMDMLLRVKENWCLATFMPPTNELDRLEFKLRYLSYLAKNDGKLDSAELKCLLVYVAPNLAYSTDIFKDDDYEIRHATVRLVDIAKSISLLDVEGMDLAKQDDVLKAMNEFFRHHVHQIYAKNTYNKWTKEEFYNKTKDAKGLTPRDHVRIRQKEYEDNMQEIGYAFKEAFQKMIEKAREAGVLFMDTFGSKSHRLRVRSELQIFASVTHAKDQNEYIPDGLKKDDGVDESLNLRQPSFWQLPRPVLRMDKVQLKEEGEKDDNYPTGFGRTKGVFQKGLLDLILLRSSGQHSSIFKLATETTFELTTPPRAQIIEKFAPYFGKYLPWLFN